MELHPLGEVLFIWGFRHHLCTPSQAEAAAILRAVYLAIQEQWMSVIIEGDAQVCFNALSSPDHVPDWNISTIVSNIICLLFSFVSCKFRWIRRGREAAILQHMQQLDLLSAPSNRFVSIKAIFPVLLSLFVRGIALCVLSFE